MDHDTITFHVLKNSSSCHWGMMPEILERIRVFTNIYNEENDADELVNRVSMAFVLSNPTCQIIAGVQNDKIFGHVLSYIQDNTFLKTKSAFIIQAQTDIFLPKSKRREVFGLVESWAQEHEASYIEMWTHIPERFWKFYGFNLHRSIMRKRVN